MHHGGMTTVEVLADVERTLERTLGAWAAASVITGGVTAVIGRAQGNEEAVQFGRQSAAWGIVDGVIAGVGALTRRRRPTGDDAVARARRLRRILLVNAVADVGYIAGGVAIARRGRRGDASARFGTGDGLAMVVQGGFLLVLDLSQARRLTA